jgi:hypothetical protein
LCLPAWIQDRGHYPLVLEHFRHVYRDDALGQTFDDRRFANSRFADQHRIVFSPAGENLYHSPDLLVPADHGIELSAPGLLGKIPGIAF